MNLHDEETGAPGVELGKDPTAEAMLGGDEAALPNPVREYCLRLMERFEVFMVDNLVTLRTLPTDCLIFAAGYGHKIDCYSQKDIVTRHGGSEETKANVSKYIKRFQRAAKIGAVAEGQRSEVANNNMRRARLEQLKQG